VSVRREAASSLRPPPGDRHGPLVPMMLALTFVTGVVDATSYLQLGHVFVANMTGNVVFLGFALAGAQGVSAPTSLVALGAFLIGAVVGGRIGVRAAENRGRVLRDASAVQLALLALALIIALAGGEPPHTGERYALVAVAAMLLGALSGGLLVLHVAIAAALAVAGAIVLTVALAVHALSQTQSDWTRA
jgi:uncharacterized membrane protein YoaK (UPF0700 family)